MKKTILVCAVTAFLCAVLSSSALAQDYVGSEQCKTCHNNVNQNLGYNIWEEYTKTGHPYKLNLVGGAPPVYPDNTSPGVPAPPPGTNWSEFIYVIGGYGWKARFVKSDGHVFTATEEVQYNLETQSWVAYHFGEDVPYSQSCFKCHTTGDNPDGSWNAQTPNLGSFSEPGIRCEGCHGPGGDHVANPTGVKLPNQGDILKHERCGDCHQRGGRTNAIPASGGYIKHHEQLNEMQASKHSILKCGTCHDTHIAGRYPGAAGEGLKAIKMECSTCHADHEITINGQVKNIDCIDCHMPMASKSAVGKQKGNGWEGDVKTHIFHINTAPVMRDAMFTQDGSVVALDNDGRAAVTLDFACLSCHQQKDVAWAAGYAENIHDGIVTGIGEDSGMPIAYNLGQNYPNPFNPSTTIPYELPKRENVRIDVLDTYGRVVAVLVDEEHNPGSYQVDFSAHSIESGVYFCRLATENSVLIKKMILLK